MWKLPTSLMRLVRRARRLGQALGGGWRHWRRRSHVQRWADEGNLMAIWDDRTARLACLVPPGSRVLEFGAGRMTLREHLPPGCTYRASDLVPRDDATFVCDLNARPLPELPEADVAVFSGVLEYVYDVPGLLAALQERYRIVLASYAPLGCQHGEGWVARRSQGWVNDFTSEELVALFMRHGYVPQTRQRWYEQDLYRFDRQCVHVVGARRALVEEHG